MISFIHIDIYFTKNFCFYCNICHFFIQKQLFWDFITFNFVKFNTKKNGFNFVEVFWPNLLLFNLKLILMRFVPHHNHINLGIIGSFVSMIHIFIFIFLFFINICLVIYNLILIFFVIITLIRKKINSLFIIIWLLILAFFLIIQIISFSPF